MAKMTMAQAIVKFLDNQYVSFDGVETKFVDGIFTVFGHGIVLGLGEALDSDPFGIAVKKDNKELLDMINAGLKNLKENGTYKELCDKYEIVGVE